MEPGTLSGKSEFILELSQTQELQLFLFLVFLLVCTTTVMGNHLTMFTVTWFQAPHTHVFSAVKLGSHRRLFLLSPCPKDAGGLPRWEEDHLLPGLWGSGLLSPLSGRCHDLVLYEGLWPLHSHLPAPLLCHHHEHSALCGVGGDSLDGRFCSFHLPTGPDAPTAFLWPQCPR